MSQEYYMIMLLEAGEKQIVKQHGANPVVFNGKLYYSEWIDEYHKFITRVEKI